MWFNHGCFAVTLVHGMGDRIYPGGLFCQFSVPSQMSYWDLHVITILVGDLICCKCQLGHPLQISLTVCCSCSHGNWIQYITSPNLAQRCYGWSQMEQPCFLYWMYYNNRAQESTNWKKEEAWIVWHHCTVIKVRSSLHHCFWESLKTYGILVWFVGSLLHHQCECVCSRAVKGVSSFMCPLALKSSQAHHRIGDEIWNDNCLLCFGCHLHYSFWCDICVGGLERSKVHWPSARKSSHTPERHSKKDAHLGLSCSSEPGDSKSPITKFTIVTKQRCAADSRRRGSSWDLNSQPCWLSSLQSHIP